jgi:hypothetical protein
MDREIDLGKKAALGDGLVIATVIKSIGRARDG